MTTAEAQKIGASMFWETFGGRNTKLEDGCVRLKYGKREIQMGDFSNEKGLDHAMMIKPGMRKSRKTAIVL